VVSEDLEDAPAESVESVQESDAAPKPQRGRPPKLGAKPTIVKQGRGRPPKAKAAAAVTVVSAPAAAESEPEPKRSRGRPAKTVPGEPSNVDLNR
jgi:hypothetical protein